MLLTFCVNISFIIKLISPIVKNRKGSVQVTAQAEDDHQTWIREKHTEMLWENQKVYSFYMDNKTGHNKTLYPRSHTHYWWSTLLPNESHFIYKNVSKPLLLSLTSTKAFLTYNVILVAAIATFYTKI